MITYRAIRIAAGLIGLLILTGCDQPAKKEAYAAKPLPHIQAKDLRVDGARAFQMLKDQVDIGGRPAGSENARRCADYIAEKVRSFGFEPEIDEWTEETANGPLTFRNVYASWPGLPAAGEQFLLLGSHFDTKKMDEIPDFVGANDAASSTALLLEIMQVIASQEKWHALPLRFAFFDGEEAVVSYGEKDGLHGSKRLAASLKTQGQVKNCRAMILLDMIGDKDLSITLSRDTPGELAELTIKTAATLGMRERISYLPGAILDDHVPFARLGIPAIDLIDFRYGVDNEHWHTATDNLDNVSADSLQMTGDLVLALIQNIQPKE